MSERYFLAARTRMENGRPVQIARAVLSGRMLMDADDRLRRTSGCREAWLCLREIPEGSVEALRAAPPEVLWSLSSLAVD